MTILEENVEQKKGLCSNKYQCSLVCRLLGIVQLERNKKSNKRTCRSYLMRNYVVVQMCFFVHITVSSIHKNESLHTVHMPVKIVLP